MGEASFVQISQRWGVVDRLLELVGEIELMDRSSNRLVTSCEGVCLGSGELG